MTAYTRQPMPPISVLLGCSKSKTVSKNRILSIALSPSGTLIAVGDSEGIVSFWDFKTLLSMNPISYEVSEPELLRVGDVFFSFLGVGFGLM